MRYLSRFPSSRAAIVAAVIGTTADATLVRANVARCNDNVPVAFIGAEVLTMTDSILKRPPIVLVQSGKIAAMGTPNLPANVCRIDAKGLTLLPGLADMHAHMSQVDLPLFLANGVTLVRELNGSPTHLDLRSRIASGSVVGPRLIVGSPLMTGKKLQYRHRLITSPEEAFAAAHEVKNAGYDFIKIYDDLSVESYNAFVEAGNTLGLKLDGHIPREVGLERVLAAGQSIQHMDKIVFALAGHGADTLALRDAERLFKASPVWVTPTLASLRAMDIAGTAEYANRFRNAEMIYVDSGGLGWWKSMIGSGDRRYSPSRFYRLEHELLPVLRRVGVRFLLGTDAANPLMVAGFSVHEELATLVRDGAFTPYQALRSTTSDVGAFLGDSTVGVVRIGARADLLLVAGNPLRDLGVLRNAVGVMTAGRWFTRQELEDRLKSSVQSSLPR